MGQGKSDPNLSVKRIWTLMQMSRVLGLHPKILRTCKTIFEEAAPILIQRNRYVFHSSHSVFGTDLPPVSNPDYSWQIMLHRYRSTILPLSLRIVPPSHRIRMLGLCFGNELQNLRLFQTSLGDHLNENNMLKDLRISIRNPWSVRALQQGLGTLARLLGHFRVTLIAVHGNDALENDPFFDNLEQVMLIWNQRQARKFLLTDSRELEGGAERMQHGIQEWTLEL